jgi:lysozyme family protein
VSYKNDAAFLGVIDFVLNSEGGYVNHPEDPGGPTMRGIAWNYNAGWLKENGYPTPESIKNLTKDDAIRCYYERYWLASGAQGLTDPDMSYLHLDSAVQHGASKAKEFLRSLPKNPRSFDFSGGKNKDLGEALFQLYLAERLEYYAVIKKFPNFGRGWMNRAAAVLRNAAKIPG